MTIDRRTATGLAAALTAAAAFLFATHTTSSATPPPAGRPDAATAWPHATRADLSHLRVTPLDFLDARTAVGTLASPDGAYLRLVVSGATGPVRDLTRLPADAEPQFAAVTVAGPDLVWAQTADRQNWQIWTAPQSGGPPRRLVTDAGDVLFGGGQYDLVVNAGRVYWATAAEGADSTDIRSIPLTGGPVETQAEPGQWSLDAWPWLYADAGGTDHASGAGTATNAGGTGSVSNAGGVRLRDLVSGRERPVRVPDGQVGGCTPDWCRVMVLTAGGDLRRIDLVRPDGTGRRSIAGPGARSAVEDVAVLGRFEVVQQADAFSDLTGSAALVVYDIAEGRPVLVAPQAGDVSTHDGMLWWSTGPSELIWHTLDLRTA